MVAQYVEPTHPIVGAALAVRAMREGVADVNPAVAVPLVLSAAVGHVLNSGVDWAVLIPLVLGGTPGTYFGARISAWINQSVIRRGIVIVLTLTGLKMLGVSPTWIGIIGGGMLLLGPLAWGGIRQLTGLPAFDENRSAWRSTDSRTGS